MLGSGPRGTVYEARLEGVDVPVAVRVLEADAIERERLRGQRSARIGHPVLVRLEAPKRVEGLPVEEPTVVLMDRVRGASCDHLQKRQGPFPPTVALAIVAQVAGCLEAATAAGLPTRVEASDIVLTPEGEVRVIELRDGDDGVQSLGLVLWCLISGLGPTALAKGKVRRWSPGVDETLGLVRRMTGEQDRPTAAEVAAEAERLAAGFDGDTLVGWAASVVHLPALEPGPLTGATFTEASASRRSRTTPYLAVIGGAAAVGALLAVVTVAVAGLGAWYTYVQAAPTGVAGAPVPEEVAQAGVDEPVDRGTPEDHVAATVLPPERGPLPTDAPQPGQEPAPVEPDLPGDPVLDGLGHDLVHPDPARRLAALKPLEEDSRSAPALYWLMGHDPASEVREEAFEVLTFQADRGIGDPEVHRQALADILMDRLRFSQRKAAHAYGRIGQDLAPLAHVLHRGSPTARNETIRAVVEIAERTGQQAEARQVLEKAQRRITSRSQRKTLEEALEELAPDE